MRILSQNIAYFKYLLCFVVAVLASCKNGTVKQAKDSSEAGSKSLLVVYCENSMIPLMLDFEKGFERKYHCDVKIVNDCANNLVELIEYSKKGDIFIPDAGSAFELLRKNSTVSITDSILVGYNRIVLRVEKDNPLGIPNNLQDLSTKGFTIAVANSESSSLGHETRKMLESTGYYNKSVKNIVAMTIDAKGLDKMIQNNEADYAFSWASNYPDSKDISQTETIELMPVYEVPVYLGMMSCSSNRIFAKYFMDFVSSGDQTDLILKNGLKKRRSQVF